MVVVMVVMVMVVVMVYMILMVGVGLFHLITTQGGGGEEGLADKSFFLLWLDLIFIISSG